MSDLVGNHIVGFPTRRLIYPHNVAVVSPHTKIFIENVCKNSLRGGSKISEEGVQMQKRGVLFPDFTQNLLNFPMKMK